MKFAQVKGSDRQSLFLMLSIEAAWPATCADADMLVGTDAVSITVCTACYFQAEVWERAGWSCTDVTGDLPAPHKVTTVGDMADELYLHADPVPRWLTDMAAGGHVPNGLECTRCGEALAGELVMLGNTGTTATLECKTCGQLFEIPHVVGGKV
ncbi:MAG: hypothetical protein GY953_24315 [bacterium]|nr:hypothetical protein [bacterium]